MASATMSALAVKPTTGAELFLVSRYSEALSEYDTGDLGENECRADVCSGETPSGTITSSKKVYTACNRAAAKLELEMCRSCLRDCDEAIKEDPFCLRAHLLKGIKSSPKRELFSLLELCFPEGQALQRLGKPARAREAFEAGASFGRYGGDVHLFVELSNAVCSLTQDEPDGGHATAPSKADGRDAKAVPDEVADATKVDRSEESCDQHSRSSPESGSREDPLLGEVATAEVENLWVGALDDLGDGSGDEGEAEGDVDDISVEANDARPGAEEMGESPPVAAKKKKKKKKSKSKSKRNKAGKNTWTGGELEFGERLTLRANKDGGGLVVEGLKAVLAASDISPVLLEAARGQLSHAVGDPEVDNLIALGYLQVNTGNYRKAVELFQGLLSIRPGLIGAHLGLGSALALLGSMDNALVSFSAAIEANSMEPDCWKRRGQTRAAIGHAAGALGDLDRAVELFKGRDADVYHQRGMVYHKLRYYNRAVLDFAEVVKSNVDAKVDWNMIGLCRGQLGEPELAERAFRRALAIDPSFKEAYANLGSLLRDWGKGEEALAVFDRALDLDAAYVRAYHLRGLCKHGLGDHKSAQEDFLRGLNFDSQDEHCRYMAALCMHARGQFEEAVRCYDALLSIKPGHHAWYNRENCVYLWCSIRRPWREFSPDAELDPAFKEGWCKQHDPMILKRYKRHRKPTGSDARVIIDERAPHAYVALNGGTPHSVAAFAVPFARPTAVEAVVTSAVPLGPGIQLNCPGFLRNIRQHRMFGLAALEVAQLVRVHWDSVKSGGDGAVVPDAGSSAWRPATGARGHKGGGHPVGYRDVFDVAVRWRQLSEPNDAVWWIDRLTPDAFEEGFGLQTPMVNGQLKVIRYYPYFSMAVDLMKRLMLEQVDLETEAKAVVSKPDAGLADLYEVVGHDHWVVTPCERPSQPPGSEGRKMEGTRLTIVASPPEGFEFTIRTPGTPSRWREYDEELGAIWDKLTAAACEADHEAGNKGMVCNDDLVCDLILQIFYLWVNFGALTRGTATCGYVVLCGLMLAAGWRLMQPLPANVQMDWEAILRTSPEAFLECARPWLRHSRRRDDSLKGLPAVSLAFPTALEVIKALNIS